MDYDDSNLARTGACSGPGLTAEPSRLVRLRTPGGGAPSRPAVMNGVVYVGDATGAVCAFDRDSGSRLWHRDHSAAVHPYAAPAAVAVGSGRVVVDAGGRITAHDAHQGELLWEIEGFHVRPTIADDMLLVLEGLDSLHAVDLASGARRWSSGPRFDGAGYGFLQTRPTVAGGRVFVVEGFEGNHVHGGLHAFAADTGRLLWGVESDTTACPDDPACVEDDLMVAPFHPVYAYGLVWTLRSRDHAEEAATFEFVGADPADGSPRHRVADSSWPDLEADEYPAGAPVFTPGAIIRTSSRRIEAVALDTGIVRWTRSFAAEIVGTPLWAGGTLHTATADGALHAVDAETGSLSWSLTLDAATSWTPDCGEYDEPETPFVLSDGALYVCTDNEVLVLR
ncbi:PQQ-binding-like beta-propeller repeat protein [Yinghuangia soli]|uniref:PQQ-binding-like beta-propeller repeat protein n=1 Tax=Yinghuangia soli TaxID=2908204 RepID=A0AA41TZC2_9ACTN|nr:PQQ-binding-like beta-propeller repeat protein [Yinghuangia soli]MCF2527130.1 PQQ-binding-like beta-propeller repeat protein [Yinghuangia soli]